MPLLARLVCLPLDDRLPRRTRLDLLVAGARRRLRVRPAYAVRYGGETVFLSHDDYAIDLKTLKSVVVDEAYAADYSGAIVLDVGAHKGYFGAYAFERGARAVVSFEPEDANLELLRRSATLRGDWHVRPVAVGAETGTAALHVMGASWGHSLHPPDAFSRYEVGVREVRVVALSEALAEARALGPQGARAVVKLNIEGEECPTVLETPISAWEQVSEVFVETHPWAACGDAELEAHLTRAGLQRIAGGHPRVLRMRREADARSGPRTAST